MYIYIYTPSPLGSGLGPGFQSKAAARKLIHQRSREGLLSGKTRKQLPSRCRANPKYT